MPTAYSYDLGNGTTRSHPDGEGLVDAIVGGLRTKIKVKDLKQDDQIFLLNGNEHPCSLTADAVPE